MSTVSFDLKVFAKFVLVICSLFCGQVAKGASHLCEDGFALGGVGTVKIRGKEKHILLSYNMTIECS